MLSLGITAVSALLTLATVGYLIGWLADLPFLPWTVDRPPGIAPAGAILVNIGLIALFGAQHSLMAREGVKQRLARLVSPGLVRSFYLLATCFTLWLLYLLWQPIGGYVWRVENAAGAALLWALFVSGWLLGGVCILLMHAGELFGFKQASHPDEDIQVPGRFRTPWFYARVRHPLYLGFFLCFWSTPRMSWGHALFAAGMSLYVLIGIFYEERDLVRQFGDAYRDYRRRAGMLLPRLRRRA